MFVGTSGTKLTTSIPAFKLFLSRFEVAMALKNTEKVA
jgi:hypothetical protein